MVCLACECSFSLASYLTRVPADAPAERAVHLLPGPFTKELSVPRGRRSLPEPRHLDLFTGADWKAQGVGEFLTRSPSLAQQTRLPSAKVPKTETQTGTAAPPPSTDNSIFSFYLPLYAAPPLLSCARCLLPAHTTGAVLALP